LGAIEPDLVVASGPGVLEGVDVGLGPGAHVWVLSAVATWRSADYDRDVVLPKPPAFAAPRQSWRSGGAPSRARAHNEHLAREPLPLPDVSRDRAGRNGQVL